MGREEIQLILEDYYPNINEFLGDIIKQRLKSPNYEDSTLISRLLKASSRLPSLKEEENAREKAEELKKQIEEEEKEEEDEEDDFDFEYYDDYDYEDDYIERPSTKFRLDSGLCVLDNTLSYGRRDCEGFERIFQSAHLSKPQEIDNRIAEVLTQVKAFEFLSKWQFKQTTAVESKQDKSHIGFTGNMHKMVYALVATRLYSAKHIEEHIAEYGELYLKSSLKNDITHAIDQKYPQLTNVYRTCFGVHKGLIFISSGRDYFGHRRYENSLYGLKPTTIHGVLNSAWATRKSGTKNYKHLHHIVVTKGRAVENSVVYPFPKWE
jgi:hypothetical protein